MPHFCNSRTGCTPGASLGAAAEVAEGMERFGLHDVVTHGVRVAITAGSRAVEDLPAALRAAVAAVLEAGGDPFIACMGSHGGATAVQADEALRPAHPPALRRERRPAVAVRHLTL